MKWRLRKKLSCFRSDEVSDGGPRVTPRFDAKACASSTVPSLFPKLDAWFVVPRKWGWGSSLTLFLPQNKA